MKPLVTAAMFLAILLAGCRMGASPGYDAGTTPAAAASRATAAATDAAATAAASALPEVNIHCDTDADCAVKDIGSCCGYYPRCVNKDSPTYADQVKAQCGKEGRSGVCGFPSVRGCECVAHQCVNRVDNDASVQ